jgi:hypothetical protein
MSDRRSVSRKETPHSSMRLSSFNPVRQSFNEARRLSASEAQGPRSSARETARQETLSTQPSGSGLRSNLGHWPPSSMRSADSSLQSLRESMRSTPERSANLPSSSSRNVGSGHYETDRLDLSVPSRLGLSLNYESFLRDHPNVEGPWYPVSNTSWQETLSTQPSGSGLRSNLGHWPPSSMRSAGMSSTLAWERSHHLASDSHPSLGETMRGTQDTSANLASFRGPASQERDRGPLREIMGTSSRGQGLESLFESPPNLPSSSHQSLHEPTIPTLERSSRIDPGASSSLLWDVVSGQATVPTQETSYRRDQSTGDGLRGTRRLSEAGRFVKEEMGQQYTLFQQYRSKIRNKETATQGEKEANAKHKRIIDYYYKKNEEQRGEASSTKFVPRSRVKLSEAGEFAKKQMGDKYQSFIQYKRKLNKVETATQEEKEANAVYQRILKDYKKKESEDMINELYNKNWEDDVVG